MKRPILIITIGLLCGIIWELYFNKSLAPFLFAIVIFLILIMNKNNRIIKNLFNKNNIKAILLFGIAFIICILYITNLEKRRQNIIKQIDNNELVYTGTVISSKKVGKYEDTYMVKIEEIGSKQVKQKNKFKCFIRVRKKELIYGEKIMFSGKFEKPVGRTNYKGFSYEEYLLSKGVYGTIRNINNIKVINSNNVNIIEKTSFNCKNIIEQKIKFLLANETGELALGFLLGETEKMDEDLKLSFRNASLSHLLAVSGMHISYVILAVTVIMEKTRIGKKTYKIITVFVLVFFMYLTGFTPSVTRACLMGIIVLIADIICREKDFFNSISLSLLIILVKNPFSIYNIGLQLSFAGTIGIVLFSENVENLLNKLENRYENKVLIQFEQLKYFSKIKLAIEEILSVTISAQVMIIPIIILNFNTISLTFFVSNILSSFFIGPIIIGGFVLVFVSIIPSNLAIFLAGTYNWLLQLFIQIVNICSKIPGAKVNVISINSFMYVVYYISIITANYYQNISLKQYKNSIDKLALGLKSKLLKNRNIIKKCLFVLCFIFVTLNIIQMLNRKLKIYIVDVGQGDCTIIVTPKGKTIIIDGGGSENPEANYDVGKSVVVPYLLNRKIIKIDHMIISHFDSDHVGGLLTVMEELKVNNVIISKQGEECENYKRFKDIVKRKNINVIIIGVKDSNTQRVQIEKEVYIEFLWPDNSKLINENILNNNSIVCKLNYNNFSMLFTGDIEEVAEKRIIQNYKDKLEILKSTVLKVAHHGSKTSSTQEFVQAVMPKISVIGVGRNNKFGHPNGDVIKRLKDARK